MFLKKWKEKCITGCLKEVPKGLSRERRWLNLPCQKALEVVVVRVSKQVIRARHRVEAGS